MNANIQFYVNLLDDPAIRNQIDTPAKCEQLIDQMENEIPHDELPQHYDWLVARRNRLEAA